jgi:ABC-2 type transport system ATP-binding protein
VFLTTHYLEEADALCDRVIIIDNGMTAASGTPDELKRQVSGDVVTLRVSGAHDATSRAQKLLGTQLIVRDVAASDGDLRLTVEHGEEALPTLLRVLDGAGLSISSISLSRPTLDDVFLTLTGRSLRDDSPSVGKQGASDHKPGLTPAPAVSAASGDKE